MKTTLALVGRPNVGKSTLFNRLTRSRDALVADLPGLTRDRHYGKARVRDRSFIVIDTGGLEPDAETGIYAEMAAQTRQAIVEADVVWFLVDGRAGLSTQDQVIAGELRRSGRQVWLVVNKAEGMRSALVTAEFHELGLGEPVAISAAHGDGVAELVDLSLPAEAGVAPEPGAEPAGSDRAGVDAETARAAADSASEHPRIAIIGRPNVGKSTLVNRLIGEQRVIAFDQPGTTRDSIAIDFERDGRPYTVIDTAGIRRRGKVSEVVEKFSVIKTLQAIEDANVCVLVLDAQQDVSEQDAHLAGYILDAGRSLVVALNKWDGLPAERREAVTRDFERKLHFLGFARLCHISALRGSGMGPLMAAIRGAYSAAMARLPTPRLTRVLQEAVSRQSPPRSGLQRPKPRYAHQGGSNPPVIVVHGNSVEGLPESYRRYLEHCFRDAFRLQGTPLRVAFRQGDNPFADKPLRKR
jgi:GTP-binding protein